jgi:hypothetical protein
MVGQRIGLLNQGQPCIPTDGKINRLADDLRD